MKVTAALPSGVSALLFESARRRRRLEGSLVELIEGRGYSEAILPILDYLEPYEPLLSSGGRAELYRFIDRDGEQLALRADFTPMLARLVAPRLASLELPLRFYYRGDVVRYREDRPGLQREAHQMGAELLGAPGEQAEEEVFDLFLELLQAAGLKGLRVVLGFAGALEGLISAVEGLENPALRTTLLEAVARRDRHAVRTTGGALAETLLQIMEAGVPAEAARLGDDIHRQLCRLDALCVRVRERQPDVAVGVDLAEFAGFSRDAAAGKEGMRRSYYDGFLFRAYAAGGARPIGSGGRYDSLFRSLGAEVPAVGFSLSLDQVLDQAVDLGPTPAEETGR